MSNNKQSSVEWFAEKLENETTLDYSHAQAHKIITLDVYQFNDLLEQAKAMHKDEMIEFARNYMRQLYDKGVITAETFYKETYEGGNNEQQ